jgi:SagB-type dehydrogenase family enzyme
LTVTQRTVPLPAPRHDGKVSLEKTLLLRRSVRRWKKDPLTLEELSQLLWAAQGVTDARGFRTAPSAGALYPLEIYLVSGRVDRLPAGIYHCRMLRSEMSEVTTGDLRTNLCQAALGQTAVATAPASVAISANYKRVTATYGERGIRYADMEAGHVAQNISLQAVALNLASVVIGAFRDRDVHRLLQLAPDETPLYLIPVGRPL